MGTDIHFYVEHRVDAQSPWKTADEWRDYDRNYGKGRERINDFYDGRNYSLFAILANVRNGYGFAGVSTGSGFNVIAEPRGWPEDCCPELREIENEIEHTPTWLMLRDILDFDWTQKTTKSGVVTLREWARWKAVGEPNESRGGIFRPNITHIGREIVARVADDLKLDVWDVVHNNDEAAHKLSAALAPGREVYTEVEWKKTYGQCAAGFWCETIPRLLRLGVPENVRCVFYFDS